MFRLVVIALLFACWPGSVFAQYRPYAPPAQPNNDARTRRATRERTVAHLGTEAARAFVETPYGDEACYAIFTCSLPVARQLAEFHVAGDLDKLPRPRNLLAIIAQYGDDAALYAIRHPRELQGKDSMDAFLAGPLDIALGLKPLEVAASESRARRLSYNPASQSAAEAGPMVLFVVGVMLLALLIWWKRRQAAV